MGVTVAKSRFRWFRVEMNGSGAVASCREVEAAGDDSRAVYYLQALDAKAAARKALNAHAARLLATRRAKYKTEGRCKCGAPLEKVGGFKQCQRCRDLARVYDEREALRKKGIEPPPRDRREALHERKVEEIKSVIRSAEPSLRLGVLMEVQRAWASSHNNAEFTKWLQAEIAAARGRKAG